MKYNKEDVISKMNHLLTRNYDAEQGYVEAGMQVNDPDLVKWFSDNAATRKRFGKELKEHIVKMGGEPDRGTSVLAELHHTWMDLKNYFTSDTTEPMIEECIRGEERALEDYQNVQNEVRLPADINWMLAKHTTEIKSNIHKLRQLATEDVSVSIS